MRAASNPKWQMRASCELRNSRIAGEKLLNWIETAGSEVACQANRISASLIRCSAGDLRAHVGGGVPPRRLRSVPGYRVTGCAATEEYLDFRVHGSKQVSAAASVRKTM